jgi:hypothetical protein
MKRRTTITINSAADRDRARRWITLAPIGARFEFKGEQRTLEQNERMWAMLSDLSAQLRWHGRALTKEDWKLLFLDALDREYGAVPNLDGTGFVSLGKASSDLSIAEASDLIELIFAFGAQHAVVWSNEKNRAEAAA